MTTADETEVAAIAAGWAQHASIMATRVCAIVEGNHPEDEHFRSTLDWAITCAASATETLKQLRRNLGAWEI